MKGLLAGVDQSGVPSDSWARLNKELAARKRPAAADTSPVVCKRPAAKSSAGDKAPSPKRDKHVEGEGDPPEKILKSSERRRVYSTAYHKAVTSATRAGRTKSEASQIGRVAGQAALDKLANSRPDVD